MTGGEQLFIVLVACAFFILGTGIDALFQSWRARTAKHKCQWRTLYKREAFIDAGGFWVQRCDGCSTETISLCKWVRQKWYVVETQYRPGSETSEFKYGVVDAGVTHE